MFCLAECWFNSLAKWSNLRPKIPLPLLQISQQDLGWHLCSSLPSFEESANSFCWFNYSFHYHTNPTTGSTRGNQQHWQSNPETGSCSFRESNVPPHWRSRWWCRHAGRSGAAEPQRCGDGRDGGPVLWVQQQVMLFLWFRHLWGTHQGRAGALSLHFSPPSHTFTYQGSQDAERENPLVSAAEQTASPHSAADPLCCCCLSLGFEVHLMPLQTLLSQLGWCSTHPRYSLHTLIPVFPRFWWCSAQGVWFDPSWLKLMENIKNANGFPSKIKSNVAMAAVVGSKSYYGLLSHPDPLSPTLQPCTPFHAVNLSSRYYTTFPVSVVPSFLPSTVLYFLTDVLLFSRLLLILRLLILKV